MFAYYGLNQCVRSDEGSFFFSYCDSDKGVYTLVQFSDTACKDFLLAVTTKMEVRAVQCRAVHPEWKRWCNLVVAMVVISLDVYMFNVLCCCAPSQTCVYQDSTGKEMDPNTYSSGSCN